MLLTLARRLALSAGLMVITSAMGFAQISMVHATACGSSSCTIPATGSGHLLVIGFEAFGGSGSQTITSVTDNVGNVYTEAGAARAVDTSQTIVVDIWYAKNSVAGATSVNVTTSAAVSGSGTVVWEFSGVDNSSPLDQTSVLNNQGASATPTGAAVSTTAASEVVISLAEVANSVTGIASGNAFTNDASLLASGWAHLITSATGSYSAQWSQSPSGSYASSTVSFKAAGSGSTSSGACDLATPYGVIDSADVQAIINMTLGISPCTANIAGAGVCNAAVVQRVINAELGGSCVTGYGAVPHYTSLSWSASTSSNIVGYNVYRGSASGGPYTKITSSVVTGTTFTDSTVIGGQTYFYVVTAVDNTGAESAYSTPSSAAVVSTP